MELKLTVPYYRLRYRNSAYSAGAAQYPELTVPYYRLRYRNIMVFQLEVVNAMLTVPYYRLRYRNYGTLKPFCNLFAVDSTLLPLAVS